MNESLLADAVLLQRRGDRAAAEALVRKVLQSQPKNLIALNLLSTLTADRGNLTEALRLAKRATALAPDEPAHWYHQSNLLILMGATTQAVTCLDRALALQPDDAATLINRASLLSGLKRPAEALESLDRALALEPDSMAGLANRALVLLDLRRPLDALETVERGLAAHPNDAVLHNRLGMVLAALDRHQEAVAAFDRSLALDPRDAHTLNSLGASLHALGRAQEAVNDYEKAVSIEPGDPWLHWNLGLCRLLTGEYARAWPDYEWRLKARPMPRFDRPLWQGEPLRGRTLLLHTEQGLGDIIQFCRYAPLIEGGRVILQAPEVLLGLLRSLSPSVAVVSATVRPPRFDLHCPLLSLPARFGSTLADLPRTVPYLSVPGPVPTGEGRRIGICWQGNPDVRIDPERSVPLRFFAPLAEVPGVRLISLQKGFGTEQLTGVPWVETVALDTFEDTARQILSMDLTITSDTAIAHLAGALGRSVWLATSFVPDWRWGLSGESCPWYPTMRLFRQRRRGDWAGVFAEMAAALRRPD
jgi:tetratricopeptide (TPR) repeat protein